jgi:hypothetical protein
LHRWLHGNYDLDRRLWFDPSDLGEQYVQQHSESGASSECKRLVDGECEYDYDSGQYGDGHVDGCEWGYSAAVGECYVERVGPIFEPA